jgi:hypothetical protein
MENSVQRNKRRRKGREWRMVMREGRKGRRRKEGRGKKGKKATNKKGSKKTRKKKR